MKCLIELSLGLLLAGGVEASSSSSVPKYIRYPLAALILLFLAAVTGLVFYAGVGMLFERDPVGIFILALGLFLAGYDCHVVWKIYSRRNS